MRIPLPDLCDAFPDEVRVAEPVFRSYGGYDAFHGEITTIKCFEDNSLVAEKLEAVAMAECWWLTLVVP